MSLVFYYAPKSTAVTVQWALEELRIPYEKVEMDLQARDQDKAGYRALNPNGKVPLVVHDGVSIFESAAIMIHLGETFGVDRGLFPPPGLDRAEAFKWLVWTNVTLGGRVARWLENIDERVPAELRNPKVAEVARTEVERLIGILEAELATPKPYLVGGSFSLVDVHLASYVRWLGFIGLDVSRWPNLDAWLKRCIARPGHERLLAA
ncbi:MAG TPA: glutathione S-transferase family protein [Labilithrix sp.]|nr:glutathione S-transferase family protein [Labilithrix sp.]